MRIENNVVEAIILLDVGVNCDSALVAEAAAELEVVEGNGVVRGLDPTPRPSVRSFTVAIGID